MVNLLSQHISAYQTSLYYISSTKTTIKNYKYILNIQFTVI